MPSEQAVKELYRFKRELIEAFVRTYRTEEVWDFAELICKTLEEYLKPENKKE